MNKGPAKPQVESKPTKKTPAEVSPERTKKKVAFKEEGKEKKKVVIQPKC